MGSRRQSGYKSPNEDSARYQDYVIRDGRLIGKFEEMYRNSSEIPWHQDVTANSIFSDLTIAILRRTKIVSMLDVGSGLGYMTERMRRELPGLSRVVGLDISETAVLRARQMFKEIEFVSGTMTDLKGTELFNAVVSKDVIW